MTSPLGDKILEDLVKLCPRGHVEQKTMFGCPVIFVRRQMFAGVYRRALFLRIGEMKKRHAILSGKAKPFRANGREMKQYVSFKLPIKLDASIVRLVKDGLKLLSARSKEE